MLYPLIHLGLFKAFKTEKQTQQFSFILYKVQIKLFTLQNIFTGEDIRKQMPLETNEFDLLTAEWISITCRMHDDKLALTACQHPGMFYLFSLLLRLILNYL